MFARAVRAAVLVIAVIALIASTAPPPTNGRPPGPRRCRAPTRSAIRPRSR